LKTIQQLKIKGIYCFPIFLTGSLTSKKHKVFFEDPKTGHSGKRIKFDGCPYIIVGRKVYDCQHGVDRHAKEKKRKEESKLVSRVKGTKSSNFEHETRQWNANCTTFLFNRERSQMGTMLSLPKRRISSK